MLQWPGLDLDLTLSSTALKSSCKSRNITPSSGQHREPLTSMLHFIYFFCCFVLHMIPNKMCLCVFWDILLRVLGKQAGRHTDKDRQVSHYLQQFSDTPSRAGPVHSLTQFRQTDYMTTAIRRVFALDLVWVQSAVGSWTYFSLERLMIRKEVCTFHGN